MPSTETTQSKHPLAWLNVTQFLGALNDNIFRWIMLFALISSFGKAQSDSISQIIGVVFVIPFLLFTPWAGKLADRFSKQRIIQITKAAEIGVMAWALVAMSQGWTYGLYGVLFFMCLQSTFFGPSKYGIVPELVPTHQLSKANALLSGMTYLAIVLGTTLAGVISQVTDRNYTGAALACVGIAIVGFICSLRIPHTPPQATSVTTKTDPQNNIRATCRTIARDKDLLLAVLASAYFMLLASFLQMNLIPYGMDHLNFNREESTYLFLVAAIGIGVGSWWAGRLSGRHVEVGLIPLGAIGLALGSLGLALLPAGLMVSAGLLVILIGVCAGLFIVPIRALIQLRCPDAQRGQVIAAGSFLGWVGVLASAGLLYLLTNTLQLNSAQAFGVLGTLTLLLAGLSVWYLPDFLVRFIIVVVVRLLYRIRTYSPENVPQKGGALLVSNHISFVDALIIGATQQRRVRYIMSREVFERSHYQWVLRLMQTILISEKDAPKQIIRSLKEARQALDDGYLVCIFAEGGITRNGTLRRFKPGMERILKGSDHPVIPVYLGGLWGSIFSYARGKVGGWPRQLPYPVNVHFGPALPATTKPWQARQAIEELSSKDFEVRKPKRRPLAHRFIKQAKRHWNHPCISDRSGKSLNYGRTLTAATLLASRLKGDVPLGIFLPPTVASALANIACSLNRRISVNLNYTQSLSILESHISHCGIQQVLTSRTFLEKIKMDEQAMPFIFIEDILATITSSEKIRAALKARLAPASMLCPLRNFDPDEIVTLLFSSGSTGRPKAIMLSHQNILSNLEQMRAVMPFYKTDCIAGILPLFHCFGLNITLWLPMTTGIAVDFVPNPLDTKAVADSVREKKATVLLATPTFLLGYLRRIKREDFQTLRRVIVGAEKLKPKLADMFEKQFGIRPDEGYGTTELSPLVSVNIPDIEYKGYIQPGTRIGSVGLAVPGIATRVTDPETDEILPQGQEGLLWIKGPNVMRGYWNDLTRTAEVIHDGWYNTGDIAQVDNDGFIHITDRLSRFSKIGGEMVPHLRIEQTCIDALNITSAEPVLAVTSIPDERKGERLAIVYKEDSLQGDTLYQAICDSDLPNLCKPQRQHLIPVENLPILGSGKLNLRALKQVASEAVTDQKTKV